MDIKIRLNGVNEKNLLSNSPILNQKPIIQKQETPGKAKFLPKEGDKDPGAVAIDAEKEAEFKQIYQDIENLIGLKQVKELIYEVQAFINIQKLRREANLKDEPVVLHAIFSGNPGSGKTTMARLLGKLFSNLGILSKGHLLEVERADLVGEYIGHTAKKTKDQIALAKGGILFIDEAYSLARGGSKDFGREAIDALVKGMEDYREDFILILAGYNEEMREFLATNPGLNSRFPLHIDFPDYSLQELLAIANHMYTSREYTLNREGELALSRLIDGTVKTYPKYHGNGRLVRNLVEASLRKQAVRLSQVASAEAALDCRTLMEILPTDLKINISQMIAKPEAAQENANNIAQLSAYLKQLANG